MNWQQVKTKWPKVQSKFHTRWDKLTDKDLKAIAGKRNELLRRLQQVYDLEEDEAEQEAEDFIKTLH